MTTDVPPDISSHPLFAALFGRRSRRFGLGFEMTEGPYQYKSPHPPLPLGEAEEALLVSAGVGFSGVALWDQSRPLPYRSGDGRTFPSTSRGRRTALFFTNDQGVYVIDPDGESSGDLYREHRRELRRGRLDIPRLLPPLCGHNLWASNRPGSTLFMPVCDVSQALIGLIAQFVDPKLERFAAGRGMNIVDDRHGFRPAGTETWVRSGYLDANNVLPLSILERQACYFMFSEPAAICQNMFLTTEAMGFRTVVPHGVTMLAKPVGLDGVFQAYCPPFFPDMDAAVDAVLAPLSRKYAVSRSTGPVPLRWTPSVGQESG